MNKRPEGVSRKGELEKELLGDIVEQQQKVETGKYRNETSKFHKNNLRAARGFGIKQGVRRRHPARVLQQHAAIAKETSNAESAWEKALLHEQHRIEIPEEYKTSDGGMIVNQTGLVTTALDNYSKSRGKFSRTVLAGV